MKIINININTLQNLENVNDWFYEIKSFICNFISHYSKDYVIYDKNKFIFCYNKYEKFYLHIELIKNATKPKDFYHSINSKKIYFISG